MTRDRLRVKAPVGGIRVLAPALGAERERFHRGVRAIVGNAAHDREARPAVRAVRERIPEAPLERVEDFVATVGAERRIGRDFGACRAGLACDDVKAVATDLRRGRRRFDGADSRERRDVALHEGEEEFHRAAAAARVHEHTVRVVADVARHAAHLCEPPDVGTKTHALDAAAHAYRHRDVIGGTHARSQSATRLLPESATTRVRSHAATPYGHDSESRTGKPQRLSPLARKSGWPTRPKAASRGASSCQPVRREFAVSATTSVFPASAQP